MITTLIWIISFVGVYVLLAAAFLAYGLRNYEYYEPWGYWIARMRGTDLCECYGKGQPSVECTLHKLNATSKVKTRVIRAMLWPLMLPIAAVIHAIYWPLYLITIAVLKVVALIISFRRS